MSDSPAWAKGYDLKLLKSIAVIFKKEFKQHTYGAFGLPKERDAANALAEDELAYTRKSSGEIGAVAIFKLLASGSKHVDFSETQIAVLKKGDLFIKAIAGDRDFKPLLIGKLMGKTNAPATWIEIHEENAESVEMMSHLGFKKVLSKVSASSDIKSIYHTGETAGRLPDPLRAEEIPGLKMLSRDFLSHDMKMDILNELIAYEETKPWAQHYSNYNKRQSWTAFSIKGYDKSDPGFIIKPSEMSKKWKADNAERLKSNCVMTTAAEHFEKTISILQTKILCEWQRVRLMRLSSKGGELTRHADITDPEAGVQDGMIARLHIPLMTSPGCEFNSWSMDGVRNSAHFAERNLYYLDTRKPHAVVNNGERERIHLVIDVYSNEWLRGLLNA